MFTFLNKKKTTTTKQKQNPFENNFYGSLIIFSVINRKREPKNLKQEMRTI